MQRAQDWFEEAVEELRAARDLRATAHYAWACFTCQQAAEKALKALLERLTRALPLGHNLNDLISDIEAHQTVPATVRDAGRRLNRLYIPTRYPDAFPSGVPAYQYAESDADQALADAEEVIDFVRGHL